MTTYQIFNQHFKRSESKDLEGNTYILNHHPYSASERIHNLTKPKQKIIALKELKIGTRLSVSDFDKLTKEEKKEISKGTIGEEGIICLDIERTIRIISIQQKGDETIIEAEGRSFEPFSKTKEDNKKELLQKIAPKIDFNNIGIKTKIIKMLSDVFLPEQLQNMLEEDHIEILMFNDLMYLRVGDKAYRL